jgi:hypothetical protein
VLTCVGYGSSSKARTSKQPLTRAGHRNTIWKSQSLLVKLHVYAAQLYMWTVVVLAYTESTRSERQIENSTEETNFNEQASPNNSEFFIVFFLLYTVSEENTPGRDLIAPE